MSKYPGRIISATPPTVSLSEASGVWTLEEAAQYQEAGTWPLAIPGPSGADPNFNQTVLLLHGDGTNGAQNNTFLDGSTNNFTITRNGNTTQGTFSPFSLAAGEFSNFFDGATGTRLTLASNSAFAFGTGAYTMEAFVYINARGADDSVVFDCGSNTNSSALRVTATGQIALGKYGAANVITSSAGDVPLNQWVHIAIVRNSTSSNDTKMYANGVLVATGTDNNNWTVTTTPSVGGFNISGFTLNGYISNLRIVKGTAVYTSAFTPSTTPLTAISNTSLLTCQSNRFVDNSTNAFAITRNGDVRVTPFSPFAPSAAYDPAVNGGSGYFDGTGDMLETNANAWINGSENFTVEFWYYLPATGWTAGDKQIIGAVGISGCGFGVFNFAADLILVNANGTVSVNFGSKNQVIPGQWNYIAVTRSGNDHRCFVNGALTTSGVVTNSTSWGTPTALRIGAQSTTTNPITGYLSEIRVIRGTALYTGSTMTIPTAPTTQTSGGATSSEVELLCNFTNAGIFDNTGKNNLETVADAQIDTTTKKYGTGSMEFDGTGDYLQVRKTPEFEFGSGDFTIEFWANATAISGAYTGVVGVWVVGTAAGVNAWNVTLNAFNTTGKFGFDYVVGVTNNTNVFNATTSTGSWDHYAIVRSGSTLYGFKNGVSQSFSSGSSTITGSITPGTADLYIGTIGTDFSGTTLNGYIDDLRITKGVARYTANFTAPTKAFADQ
jgi:hypothetical protein